MTKTSGKTRIESLFFSLKKALKKLGLKEESTADCDFIYTFKQQKILIMKKMPQEFKESFEVWQRYHNEVDNRAALYKQMQLVEKKMKPTWPGCGNQKNGGTKFEQEFKKYAEEHEENTKQARAKGQRTRSKE